MLICEMAAYYRSIGSSIKERLEEIYAKFGRYLNKVDSFEFPGLSGMEKMAGIMDGLRKPPAEIGGYKVTSVTDYQDTDKTGLPKANVLIYALEGGATVVVRPSGTEPKSKPISPPWARSLARPGPEGPAGRSTEASARLIFKHKKLRPGFFGAQFLCFRFTV